MKVRKMFMKNIKKNQNQNKDDIGIIAGKLSLNGLRVYLFLINNNLNQFEIEDYANWLNKDYDSNSNKSRAIRKSLNDGIQNLLDNNYLIEKDKDNYILV